MKKVQQPRGGTDNGQEGIVATFSESGIEWGPQTTAAKANELLVLLN